MHQKRFVDVNEIFFLNFFLNGAFCVVLKNAVKTIQERVKYIFKVNSVI